MAEKDCSLGDARTIAADHWHDNGDGTAWYVGPAAGDRLALDHTCSEPACHEGWWLDKDDDPLCKCEQCGGTGRHTFDIDIECPTCTGKAEWCGFDGIGNPSCSNGVARYRVSIVPGMVLPIYGACPDYKPADHICQCYPDQWTHHSSGGAYDHTEDRADIPPAAEPGMWAVKLAVL